MPLSACWEVLLDGHAGTRMTTGGCKVVASDFQRLVTAARVGADHRKGPP